jgi:serine/threonine protein kinase
MRSPAHRDRWQALRSAFGGLMGRSLLALVMVGLLPLGWLAFSLVGINREAMLSQVLRTHALASRAAAERVAAFVAARGALLDGLTAHPDLDRPGEPAARHLLAESLSAWSELGVVAVVLRDPAGAEVVRVQLAGLGPAVDRLLGQVPSAAPGSTWRAFWLGSALPGSGGEPHSEPAGEELRMAANDVMGSEPMLWLETSALGGAARLGALLRATEVETFLAPEEIGDEAELLLLHLGGAQLVPAVAPAAAAAWRQRVPPNLASAALSGRVGGAGRFDAPGGGAVAETVGAYAPVERTDWVVLSLQPSRVAEAAAVDMRRRSTWAVSAAFSLIVGLGWVVWRGLVRPLRGVVEAQRRLVGGGPVLPTRHLAGAGGPRGGGAVRGSEVAGSEVTELARNLALLERSLRDRVAIDQVFVGRYRVLEVLGAGAMGTVFRGYDPKLERVVALKTLRLAAQPSGGLAPAELRRHLLREAVTVAQFSHPNIVGIYDLLDTSDAAFLAMEFVDGPSLDVLVWQRRRLDPGPVAVLGLATARALAAAHERGIIHRDVKPSNVLLGLQGAIKVSDFGIAEIGAAAVGEGGRIFGTPGYLAPEVLQGAPASPQSDLFALGATLYFCLLGRGAFQAAQTRETVRRTLRGDVMPLRRRRGDLPPALDELVCSLLRADPAARPASAAAVAGAFSALVEQLDAVWEPPRIAGEARDAATRNVLAGSAGHRSAEGTGSAAIPTWLGPPSAGPQTLPATAELEVLTGAPVTAAPWSTRPLASGEGQAERPARAEQNERRAEQSVGEDPAGTAGSSAGSGTG